MENGGDRVGRLILALQKLRVECGDNLFQSFDVYARTTRDGTLSSETNKYDESERPM